MRLSALISKVVSERPLSEDQLWLRPQRHSAQQDEEREGALLALVSSLCIEFYSCLTAVLLEGGQGEKAPQILVCNLVDTW